MRRVALAEQFGLADKHLTCVRGVEVQVRIGNTATGEDIPGSSAPRSLQGKYVHIVQLSLFGNDRLAFDQRAVGKATIKATRYAVLKALQRLEKAGW